MKPTEKQKQIFGPTGCISQEGLSLYLQDNLNEKEKHLFEKHVSGCLLCNEAVEGYEKQATKVLPDFAAMKNGLKSGFPASKIFSLKKSNNNKVLITAISIAASIVLIFTTYFLINIQTKESRQDLSFNTMKTPQATPAEEQKNIQGTDQAATGETKEKTTQAKEGWLEENKADDRNYEAAEKSNEQDKKNKRPVQTVAVSDASKDEDFSGYAVGGNVKKAADNKGIYNGAVDDGIILGGTGIVSSEADSLTYRGLKQEATVVTGQSVAVEEIPEKEPTVDQITESGKILEVVSKTRITATYSRSENQQKNSAALSFYNTAQYKQAITEFKKSADINNKDFEAIYYLAMSYYNDGQKDAALSYLDKLLKRETNPFYDLALWQKALILSEKSQAGEARKLYNEIIKRGGTLKNNAKEKVDELNKSK